jgi:type II secretory pathway component HofQ
VKPSNLVFVVWLCMVACHHASGPLVATPAPTSRRIDLELTNVPIDDGLRAFAKAAQINLSVDPDVTGTVTLWFHATPWDQVLDEIVREHSLVVIPIDVGRGRTVFRIANTTTMRSESPHFTGTLIDVSFNATPIRTVAKTLAGLAGVSIVVDDDIQQNVTQFARQLPWDFVLDHVVRKYEWRTVRSGNEIRITKR